MLKLLRQPRHIVRNLPPLEAYDLWAPTYDQKATNPLILIEEQFLTPHFESIDVKDKTIVDFGCGTGRYVKKLFDRGAQRVVGVDFSQSMLEQAKKNCQSLNAEFVNSSLESLPLRNSQYDVGISTLVLGYIVNLETAIVEMVRTLKHDGTMLIADFHPVHATLGWKRNFTILERGNSPLVYEISHYHHAVSDFVDIFKKNKLEIELIDEPCIDSSVMEIFERFDMKRTYRRYLGTPILVIFKLRKH